MKKIVAQTLQLAYEKATVTFKCSLNDLDIDIVQYSKKGLFGLFQKDAILIVNINEQKHKQKQEEDELERVQRQKAHELYQQKQIEIKSSKKITIDKSLKIEDDKIKIDKPKETTLKSDKIFNSFYDKKIQNKPNTQKKNIQNKPKEKTNSFIVKLKNEIFDLFILLGFEKKDILIKLNDKVLYIDIKTKDENKYIDCYEDIDVLMFNWIFYQHKMTVKLNINNKLESIYEKSDKYFQTAVQQILTVDKFKTMVLNNIAIEYLLEKFKKEFPQKYVGVKSTKKSKKFIVINDK